MGQESTRIFAQSKGQGLNMIKETEQLVYLRSLLAERNLEIDNLNKELERVKRIARDRLDMVQKLQHNVAVFEDKLEDTRSDVRAIEEATAQVRRCAANALLR